MPQKKIAEQEGISVSAVKTRIHRAKKELKKISVDNKFFNNIYEK
jgi:DNA-directed RNA polymerase specialized sigma24 family protein